MDDEDLKIAETQLSSLLHKCEAVLQSTSLSPSRQSLMTDRVRALQTAPALVADARKRDQRGQA